MAHTQIERQYIGQQALVASRAQRYNTDFPLGERWLAMHLRIAARVAVGATPVGGVALEDPLLEIITNINLNVDRDGVLVNAPAKALYYWALARGGTAPNMDEASFAANTAGNYDMSVHIPIFFEDRRMLRPEDTCLATDRYSKMDLTVTLGSGAECLSTAHTSGGGITLSNLTCDVEVEFEAGPIRPQARPILVQKLQTEASPIDTNTETLVKLTRDPRRGIKRLYCFSSNLGVTSRPWAGNGSNAILSTLKLASNQRDHDNARLAAQVRDDDKMAYMLETLTTGLYILDYVRDRSHWSALATGDKSKLQTEIVQVAAPPAGANRFAVLNESVEQFGA